MDILFGTTNKNKIEDFLFYILQLHVPINFSIKTLRDFPCPDVEENAETLQENSLIKARHYFRQTNLPTIADDTGFFIHALNGFPGVHSARIAGQNRDFDSAKTGVLEKLELHDDKMATFSTALAYVDENNEFVVQGDVIGEIVPRSKVVDYNGYRDIFQPQGTGKTISEMSFEERAIFTPRSLATKKIVTLLQKKGLI
jgi:XTP/dITP diphosphohydrolase